MKLPIYQVDAFTNKLFAGNPAAICPLQEWLPDKTMQAIAAENNLAETAFFIPNDSGYKLRWFTPAIEVDLCGHATLATAHVLFTHLDYAQEVIRFQTRSGELWVSQADDWYQMDFPADQLKVVNHIPEAITKSLGFTPQQVYRGRDDYMVIVDNQAQVEALEPDFRILLRLGSRGLIVTAKGDEVDFVSRCFFPPAGIDEDPVTGSAHTSMTPYWAKVLNKTDMTAMQLSSRTGLVKCTLMGDRVILGGQAVTYLQGELEL